MYLWLEFSCYKKKHQKQKQTNNKTIEKAQQQQKPTKRVCGCSIDDCVIFSC